MRRWHRERNFEENVQCDRERERSRISMMVEVNVCWVEAMSGLDIEGRGWGVEGEWDGVEW